MLHRYFPHTQEDINSMLERCGVKDLKDLYADVPSELIYGKEYNLHDEMSEKEVRDYFDKLGKRNAEVVCFAGGGVYDHYSPSAIPSIIERSEFLTAYTPYQPEVSQGTLQYIFEYQSMMTALTGLDVSNASMYDGATATAEAMIMAVAAARKKNRVLVSSTLNKNVLDVVKTYAHYNGVELTIIPAENGVTSKSAVEEALKAGDVAGVIVATPNYNGIIEDYTGWAEMCHSAKALFIINANPSTLSVLKAPGEWGADIAVGDAQSLGIPMSFGGPYLGFMCTTKALIRKMPGRIVGATKDINGQRSFVLTLQAREQHIRREKATSNICSNQGLMALYVTIYMSLLGPDGLKEVNVQGMNGAHYLSKELEATGKMKLKYPDAPYLNEFVMETTFNVDKFIAQCVNNGVLPGIKVADNEILIAVTEMQTKDDMDALVAMVKEFKND